MSDDGRTGEVYLDLVGNGDKAATIVAAQRLAPWSPPKPLPEGVFYFRSRDGGVTWQSLGPPPIVVGTPPTVNDITNIPENAEYVRCARARCSNVVALLQSVHAGDSTYAGSAPPSNPVVLRHDGRRWFSESMPKGLIGERVLLTGFEPIGSRRTEFVSEARGTTGGQEHLYVVLYHV
jgi:hypothetical protein